MPSILVGFERRGRVILNGITFATDPRTYRPLNWEKRYSVFKGVGGTVTIQDFGIYKKDDVITLNSGGDQGVLDGEAARQFHAMWRVKAATYNFYDWLGNNFTVFMSKFVAWPLIVVNDPLYEYDMELQVTAINTLFGYAYTET
jgi:hypothetical protein